MFSIRIPVFGFFFSEATAGSELEAAEEVEELNLPRAVNENSRIVHNIRISLERAFSLIINRGISLTASEPDRGFGGRGVED